MHGIVILIVEVQSELVKLWTAQLVAQLWKFAYVVTRPRTDEALFQTKAFPPSHILCAQQGSSMTQQQENCIPKVASVLRLVDG